MKYLSAILIFLLFVISANAQCGINDCPNGFSLTYDTPTIIGESIQINNVYPFNYSCLLSDSFKIGDFGAGIDFYVFQLLPDGTRMTECHVLNDYPNNVVAKTEAVNSAGDFCGFPFGGFDITIDDSKGFIPCDGGVYEIVAATWVDSLGLGTTVNAGELPRTVYDVWPNGNGIYFEDTVMATLFFDLNGGFTQGAPNTTAILKQWGSNLTGTIVANCTDVELYVEAMSTIANCPPFADITTGITSELENELYFTINNGPAIDVLTAFNPQGGILTGPDTLNNGNCYAGIFTENTPSIIPLSQFNLCEEDTVRVYLTTTDLFTGNTESDQLTILLNPNGCNACAPPCNFIINTSYNCATEQLCVNNVPVGSAISWGPSSEFGGTNPTDSCLFASPNFSTNYTVSAVNIYGCPASDIINIGYNGNVDAGADVIFFDGDIPIPLQATLPGATNFSWSPGTGLNNTNIANPVANPSATTTYEVTATNANGCVSVDEITVTVFPTNALVIDLGNDIALCDASNGININANFFPFTSCIWTLPDGTQIADCELDLSNAMLGNYTCNIMDTITSQVGLDSVSVILDASQIDAGNDLFLCTGAFGQLDASNPNIFSYVWSGGTLSNNNIANPTFTALTAQTFTVVGTSFAGCESTDQVAVFIEELQIDAGPDITICEGDTAFLDATSPNVDTYQWLGMVSQSTIATPTATPNITTTYTIFGSDNNGCNAQDEIIVNVENPINLQVANEFTIIEGDSLEINLNLDPNITISWSPTNGLSCSDCSEQILFPSETTTYTILADNGACNEITQVTIVVDPYNDILETEESFNFNFSNENFITIKSLLNIETVLIMDLSGKLIYNNTNLNSNQLQIETNNFSQGIYFLRILSDENWYGKKILTK